MDRARDLEQSPCLIDPDVAHEVGNEGTRIRSSHDRTERTRCTIAAHGTRGLYSARKGSRSPQPYRIVHCGRERVANERGIEELRAVESGCAAIVDTDRRRHTITELPRVLDVVDASYAIITTDQERGVVAWKAMPR